MTVNENIIILIKQEENLEDFEMPSLPSELPNEVEEEFQNEFDDLSSEVLFTLHTCSFHKACHS